MGLTRQEVNLRRLIAKCELMLKSKQTDERFPKYVQSLEDMIRELAKILNKSQDESLIDYKKRIYSIKQQAGLEEELDKQIYLNEFYDENARGRDELLGIRQRPANKAGGSGDLDELINYHNNMHDKIAEDMLQLTKNLKEQSQLANKIIKKDTEIVSRSAQLTDNNFTKLKSESEKLGEHSKRAYKCWMWTILMFVLFVFINMVLFMKVVKKS